MVLQFLVQTYGKTGSIQQEPHKNLFRSLQIDFRPLIQQQGHDQPGLESPSTEGLLYQFPFYKFALKESEIPRFSAISQKKALAKENGFLEGLAGLKSHKVKFTQNGI